MTTIGDPVETRAARLRLRVVNRDSPSLDVTSVDLAGPIEEVVFFQEPGHAYSLVCRRGGGAARLRSQDQCLDEGERPTPRMLGAEQARLDAASPEPVNWWNDPTILGAVVCSSWCYKRACSGRPVESAQSMSIDAIRETTSMGVARPGRCGASGQDHQPLTLLDVVLGWRETAVFVRATS
ncbi:MAG: hypothetical protein R3B96_02270 [Pirellulaceae bacterium]